MNKNSTDKIIDNDQILDSLGNITRRKILKIISKEPMYFNQLAKEVGIGQQAVLRHVKVLEEVGLIDTYTEKSTLGAPTRKYYRLNSSFSLNLVFSKNEFRVNNQEIATHRLEEYRDLYEKFDKLSSKIDNTHKIENMGSTLQDIQDILLEINNDIQELELGLNDLYALKQSLLQLMHAICKNNFEYLERNLLYVLMEDHPKSMFELNNLLSKDDSKTNIKEILRKISNRLESDNFILSLKKGIKSKNQI
ncbi:MAG: helix-turn-helix domain-containing protein [Nitrososphaeraceae archaeon]|nr:helix-turn-helix domain-containing protein [Nitrososphaeraceae archaeon]